MFDERDPPHYLRPLVSTNVPKRLLWLDCEAMSQQRHGSFVEKWSLGALGFTHWTSKSNIRKDSGCVSRDPFGLWQEADGFCQAGRRTVLFCHDLSYQLRISQALVHLPALGWELDRIVLERTAAWASLSDGKRTLLLCDLLSWTPAPLSRLADDVVKSADGDLRADLGAALAQSRCQRNVIVIRECVTQMLRWITAERLGPFRPTGSGQSYAAFRRRFMSHNLLVHDDAVRMSAERAAMWTGRCEAWQHGTLTKGPYVEYDMNAAYCRIASECDIPSRAYRAFGPTSHKAVESMMVRFAVLAEMTVTIDVPCVPTHHGGRTLWPTGTFKTVLWSPEIALALRYATSVTFHRVWSYHRAPALREFAHWTLDTMADETGPYGRMPARVAKHWSRTLVGRLGLRYRTWEDFGPQSPPDLRLVTYVDTETGIGTDMLIAGSKRMILADMVEAPESLPQIPSFVMSECRRRLWEAMTAVGLANVLYVDTDSFITTHAGEDRWQEVDEYAACHGWARKGAYSRLQINGPRNLVTQDDRHMSGLPLTARQTAPLEFTGQVMRSIKESMRAGELDCVTSLPRKWVMDAPDLRRQHVAGGKTLPFHLVPKPTIHEE